MTSHTPHHPTVTAPEPHFVWPVVDERLHLAVTAQVSESLSIYNRSGVIERVERRLENRLGAAHCLLTNSGTAALHSMYVAAGLGRGDDVIVPAYTFFATASPLFTTGARPVLVDCGPDGNIDPDLIEAAITDATKAIVVTHMWGLPCDMVRLRAIADRRGLLLLEDTSHAFSAHVQGKPVGSWGDAAAMSLQGQKPLTGGEGGVVITSSNELFYRAVAHGHYNVRCKQEIPQDHPLAEYAVTGMGLKLRIHPVSAAIVEQQLSIYDEIQLGRQACAARMVQALSELPGLTPLTPSPGDASSWYALIVKVSPRTSGGHATDWQKALHQEGAVEVDRPGSTRPLAQLPLFQRPGGVHPSYADVQGAVPDDFPVANTFHESILKLPVWHRQEDREIEDQYLAAFRKVSAGFLGGQEQRR